MVHRVSHSKLSRNSKERAALLKNLANSLILHEKILTTEARAKSIRPFVEKLITRAKENSLSNRRILLSRLGQESSVNKLLDVIGPVFKERPGGYTRIIKMPPRAGDGAKMAIVEFVENVSGEAVKKQIVKEKIKKAKPSQAEVKEAEPAEKPAEPAAKKKRNLGASKKKAATKAKTKE